MSKIEVEFRTPVGRLVGGSLYDPQEEGYGGKKTADKNGKPTVNFYFGLAIEKRGERHWAETTWGKVIWETGHRGFPNGQAQQPAFAWKITDGDSTVQTMNRSGKMSSPSEKQGYPGHWVLAFNSAFAPQICDRLGTKYIQEKDHTNPGDYIQVAASVVPNGDMTHSGVFLNPRAVAHQAFGEPIVWGIDIKKVGFGQDPLPAGASLTPVGAAPASIAYQPPAPTGAVAYQPPVPTATPALAPAPYPEILTPSVPQTSVAPPTPAPVPAAPAAPQRIMSAKAGQLTYEEFKAKGWTDNQLVHEGYMSHAGGV